MFAVSAHIRAVHQVYIWCSVKIATSLRNTLDTISKIEHHQATKLEHIAIVEELIDSNKKAFAKTTQLIISKYNVKFQKWREDNFWTYSLVFFNVQFNMKEIFRILLID